MRPYFRREPTKVGGPKLLQIKIALLAPNCLTCEKTPAFAYIPHNATVLSAGTHFSGRAEVTTNASFLGPAPTKTRVIHG